MSHWYLLGYVQICVLVNVLRCCCYYYKTLKQLRANPFAAEFLPFGTSFYRCQTPSPHVMPETKPETKPIYSALCSTSLPVLPSHWDSIWISHSDSDWIETSTIRMFPQLMCAFIQLLLQNMLLKDAKDLHQLYMYLWKHAEYRQPHFLYMSEQKTRGSIVIRHEAYFDWQCSASNDCEW